MRQHRLLQFLPLRHPAAMGCVIPGKTASLAGRIAALVPRGRLLPLPQVRASMGRAELGKAAITALATVVRARANQRATLISGVPGEVVREVQRPRRALMHAVIPRAFPVPAPSMPGRRWLRRRIRVALLCAHQRRVSMARCINLPPDQPANLQPRPRAELPT